jgi:hypothetical protein
MVREYSRHHRDSSPVNDHQWDLDITDDPCVFTKVFSSLNRKRRCPIPFVPVILEISETWSSVSPYLIQSCYWHCHLLAPWYSHSCDLLTYYNLDEISPSGPRVFFHHVEEQIPILMHTPRHTLLETQKTRFQSPCYSVMVDATKASSGSSD